MTYFSGLDKKINKHNNKPKMPKSKLWAIILTVVASVGYFGLFVPFFSFIKYFLLGTFGIVSYVLFLAMYLISGSLLKGKKYQLSKKYTALLCVSLICILSIFHMAFSGGVNLSSYGAYLSDLYTMQTSIGGVLLGLLVFPFQKLLGIGAYFFFGIVLVVCLTVVYNLIADKKIFSKIDQNLSNKKNVSQKQNENISQTATPKIEKLNINKPFADDKNQNPIGLDAEIKKEESSRDIARRKLGLDRIGLDDQNISNVNKTNQLDTFTKNYMNAGGSVFDSKPYTADQNGSFGFNVITNKSTKPVDIQQQKTREYFKFMGWEYKEEESKEDVLHEDNSISQTPHNVQTYTFNLSTSALSDDKSNHSTTQESDLKVFGNSSNNDELSKNNIDIDYRSPQEKIENLNKWQEDQIKGLRGEDIYQNKAETEHLSEIFDNNIPSEKIELPKGLQGDNYSNIKNFDITKSNPIDSEISKTKDFEQNPSANTTEIVQKVKEYHYTKPTLDLLTCVSTSTEEYGGDVEASGRKIENVLNDFKIPAKIIGITRGPAVTRYELEMPVGISVSKIPSLQNDIEMAIASSKKIMIQAPIPGMSAFGIEVPNDRVATVALRDILSNPAFTQHKSPCAFALGKEINGVIDVCAVDKMPHVLIAGSTGSGKSVCLNSLILSILYKSSPEDVRFILIDPKRVEFSIYQGLPHLILPDIISEPRKADNALGWAIKEMERRYLILEQYRVRKIDEYNNLDDVKNKKLPKMPYIIIIMDEFADMMQSDCKDIENKVKKLAAKARAAGIHLVLATQRPSVDVLSGTAKNNFPARIAFFLTSQTDSRTILGYSGAENLLGRGDMLYVEPGSNGAPKRLQGCYVSDEEVRRVVEYVIEHNKAEYDQSVEEEINKKKDADSVNPDGSFASYDREDDEADMESYAADVMKEFIRIGRASASYIQRIKRVGFQKASRILDYLAKKKYISQGDGSSKPRNVYMTKQQYIEIYGDTDFDDHD